MRRDWDSPALDFPTIGSRWIEACKQPGNPLVLSDTMGARLKAKQALTGSIILARRIEKLNPRQNVGLLLPTSAAGMLCNLACMLLGKTAVNLNFTAPMDALLSSIAQSSLDTVFTSERFLQKLQERGVSIEALENKVQLIRLEDVRKQASTLERLSTLLRCLCLPTSALKKRFLHEYDNKRTAVILFSSGSEGHPKGVMLSHYNLMANVCQVEELLDMHADDTILANLPLFHAFGLTATLFLPLLNRVPVLCHPDPRDVVTIAKAIQEHRVSIMFGTSSFFRLYIRNSKVQSDMLRNLRLAVAGAEKLQTDVRRDFQEKFGIEIFEGYGATETAPVANVNLPDDLSIKADRPLPGNKPGSVGLPIPGTSIRIVDPGTLENLPTGSAGLILISGPQVMQGYLNNEEKSNEVLHRLDGRHWYATGDKGYLDEDGFLFIIDRYSRFAKVGGEMVGLGSLEQAIRSAINNSELDVLAVNVPDERKGEKIVVLCNMPLDQETTRLQLLNRGLNALALPAAYFHVEEIPSLGSGKRDYAGAKVLALELLDQ